MASPRPPKARPRTARSPAGPLCPRAGAPPTRRRSSAAASVRPSEPFAIEALEPEPSGVRDVPRRLRRRAPPTRSRSARSPSRGQLLRLPGLRGQRPRHLQARRGRRCCACGGGTEATQAERGGIEVFLRRTGELPRCGPGAAADPAARQRTRLTRYRFCSRRLAQGRSAGPPARIGPCADGRSAARVRRRIRLSRHLLPWIEEQRRRATRQAAREQFLAEVGAGRADPRRGASPSLSLPAGGHAAPRLHGERALLADEMGLGKTVQAIAACALLRPMRGIERVLVVCPASLKGEWEEQIARFTDLPVAHHLRAPAPSGCASTREGAFFYLANYEQILGDGEEIQRRLAPGRRSSSTRRSGSRTGRAGPRRRSNVCAVPTPSSSPARRSKTASTRSTRSSSSSIRRCSVRSSASTASSISSTSAAGRRATRTSDELHRRLGAVLLRRRKDEVEGQLPARTDKHYFVAYGRRADRPLRRVRRARGPLLSRGPPAARSSPRSSSSSSTGSPACG